ncbi:HD family phosphohydrolase [Aggregatilinea lenta]|uniref:HD family phosphohydrolase n=1 Tax=Aggregatilinea lenta TaxID=913108 RepID=UPI000E5BC2B4|nr:HDIG domain-containing metalloprotein [Aggregatilinea lenta]
MVSDEQNLLPGPRRTKRLLHWVLAAGLLAAFVGSGSVVLAYDSIVSSAARLVLEVGDVSPRDVLAPRSITYESDVLTEDKREAAAASVRPVYDPPDSRVETEQIQLARQVLDFIENVRYDDLATTEQKKQDITAITVLSLSESVVDQMLGIEDESAWRAVDAQIVRLLERVMSGEIREDNIQSKRENLTNLISATYSEPEVQVIQGVVEDLVRVNTFYNDELTRQQQTRAAEDVPVEVRTFAQGQMIVREGEIATPAHIEALEQFGLLDASHHRTARIISGLLAMCLATALLGGYILRFERHLLADRRILIVLGVLFLGFMVGARLLNPQAKTEVYYYPATALAFLVTTLAGPQFGIVVILGLASLVGFMGHGVLTAAVLIGFSGTLGVLSLGRTERLNSYFVAGGIVSLSSALIAVAFALGSETSVDPFVLVSQLIGAMLNGMLSGAGALVGLYLISSVLNIPSSLKLIELMQPNHPLLQQLLREAPGTYQHSLQVANLAELGAEQIGANATLVRVAAMYHDIGKILNPFFFVENQVDKANPHDVLNDPYQSARIIIGHVTEGERLARRYRLPHRIHEFIMEHHGTTQVAYFYQQALSREGEGVDIKEFTYPGPRPRSRETAILMLADGCESSVRARRPQTKDDVTETVDFIFDARLRDRQLDDSGLTLGDLRALRTTFVSALQGMFHSRITYPGTPKRQTAKLPAGTENRWLEPKSPPRELPKPTRLHVGIAPVPVDVQAVADELGKKAGSRGLDTLPASDALLDTNGNLARREPAASKLKGSDDE